VSFNPPPPPGMEPGSSSAYLFYGAPDGTVAAPLPLGEAIRQLPGQYWKALTRPGASAFAEETGKASWNIVLVQLAGYAIIAATLALLNYAFTQSTVIALLNQLSRNTGTRASTPPAFLNSPVLSLVTTLIGILIGFFIVQAILFGLAKAFGGQGTFVQQAYIFLLFQVPLGILGSLLGLIPVGGPVFSLAASVYGIVLSVFAIMGAHQLTGGKASGVVLIPIGVALLIVCCGLFLIFALVINNTNLH
jgi:hypothetical protein